MLEIFLPFLCLTFAVIIPIDVAGSTGTQSGVDKLAFGNVGTDQSTRYAAQVIVMYILTCKAPSSTICTIGIDSDTPHSLGILSHSTWIRGFRNSTTRFLNFEGTLSSRSIEDRASDGCPQGLFIRRSVDQVLQLSPWRSAPDLDCQVREQSLQLSNDLQPLTSIVNVKSTEISKNYLTFTIDDWQRARNWKALRRVYWNPPLLPSRRIKSRTLLHLKNLKPITLSLNDTSPPKIDLIINWASWDYSGRKSIQLNGVERRLNWRMMDLRTERVLSTEKTLINLTNLNRLRSSNSTIKWLHTCSLSKFLISLYHVYQFRAWPPVPMLNLDSFFCLDVLLTTVPFGCPLDILKSIKKTSFGIT